MTDRGIGKWILPQPDIKKKKYIDIPKLGRTIPFGYKISEEEDGWLTPIPSELEALEKAKKYLKQYSLTKVAAWLSTATGRYIGPSSLEVRIKNEQSQKRRSTTYRLLANRYKEALEKAEKYERRVGCTEDSYFTTEHYREIRDTFYKIEK
jgi:hypothetical protein